MQRILICDINIKQQGHYISYDQYIVNNILDYERKQIGVEYNFLFNDEARSLLNIPVNIRDKVNYITIDKSETEGLKGRISIFKKINKYVSRHKIDHLIFMDLDMYQIPLSVVRPSYKVSGILFRPHHRITTASKGLKPKLATSAKKWKKVFAEKMLIWKNPIANIFILNDEEGVYQLNKFHNTRVFKYLPDPIFKYSNPNDLHFNKQERSVSFLVFGAINDRKNIVNILKAYQKAEFSSATKLYIVGPGKDDYVQTIKSLVQSLGLTDNNGKEVLIEQGFVSNEKMDQYFAASDVCLFVYKNFFGSSGLLGRAVMHNKRIIGPNVGLMHETIQKNQLGLTCNPDDFADIAKAMEAIGAFPINPDNFQAFYNTYSPDNFLSHLLKVEHSESINVA